MPIKYYLQPNPVTPDPNDQMARVLPTAILTINDIIKRVLKRGTTVTEADATAVLLLAFEEMSDAVAEGNHVNTDLVNLRPSIQGVFTNVNDSYDSSRHTLRASVSAGLQLSTKVSQSRVEKTDGSVISPDIIDFTDVRTSTSTQASPGGIGTISGSELKFNPANAAEGIFFINTATNAETKATEIAQRTEGKLMFSIPAALVAGTYRLEVRRAYTNAATIRSDAYDQLITVA